MYNDRIYSSTTPPSLLIKQHSITNTDDLKGLVFYPGSSLLQPRGDIDKDGFCISDNMISLIAPSCTFTSITRDHISHALYIHNKIPETLGHLYFLLLLVVITDKNNPFFSKKTLDIVIPQLSQLAQLANKQEGNFLEGLYLKELLVAYFSHKISPEAYYIWPNKENLNSAINDYFESFYLNNINKVKISINEIDFERTYYLPSKRSNLIFLPEDIFNSKEGSIESPCKAICLPIIFDTENSWKECYQYRLLEDYKLSFLCQKPWNVMSPESYKGDTKLYPISRDILKGLETRIKFNYEKSELNFVTREDFYAMKGLKRQAYEKMDDNMFLIPGLHHQTCEEILFYSLSLQQFYTHTNIEGLIFNGLLKNPERIKNYSGYKELDDLFMKENSLLHILRAIRRELVREKDIYNLLYFVDNLLVNVTNGFRGKQVAMDIEVVEKFPGIEHYNNLFNQK